MTGTIYLRGRYAFPADPDYPEVLLEEENIWVRTARVKDVLNYIEKTAEKMVAVQLCAIPTSYLGRLSPLYPIKLNDDCTYKYQSVPQ